MSHTPLSAEPRARWHRVRVSTWWWLARRAYLAFILRELSSFFVGWFILFTLWQIHAISQGWDDYHDFQAWARRPAVLALNVVSLFFIVFHAVTWLNLAPKAMVVRLRGQRVPAWWMLAGNYAAWVAVSAVLAWLVL